MKLPPDSLAELQVQIDRLCRTYGKTEIRNAVTRSKGKRSPGRKKSPDGLFLSWVAGGDAAEWMAGLPLATRRSNYALVREFTDLIPEHQQDTESRRLLRKLGAERDALMYLVAAIRADNLSDRLIALLRLVQVTEASHILHSVGETMLRSYAALGYSGLFELKESPEFVGRKPVHRAIGLFNIVVTKYSNN